MNNITVECVSKLEAVKYNYIWKVKDFHNWPHTSTQTLTSPNLSVKVLDKDLTFCVRLHHSAGANAQDNLYLCINFIDSSKNPLETNVHTKIFVHNSQAKVYAYFVEWKKFRGSGDVCWFNCLKHSSILNPESNLLVEGTLTLIFEFTIPTNVDNIVQNKNQLTISSESEHKIISDLENLLKNQMFSDLIITTSSEEKIPVHKSILAARSHVFAAMFRNEMLEKNQNAVTITDIDRKSVREMLNFIYTGRIDFSSNDAITMIQVADKYALEDLKRMCEGAISENITIENAVEVFIIADRHNAAQLKIKCSNFIGQNLDKVIKTQGFQTLVTNRDPNISEIFYQLGKLNIQ